MVSWNTVKLITLLLNDNYNVDFCCSINTVVIKNNNEQSFTEYALCKNYIIIIMVYVPSCLLNIIIGACGNLVTIVIIIVIL